MLTDDNYQQVIESLAWAVDTHLESSAWRAGFDGFGTSPSRFDIINLIESMLYAGDIAITMAKMELMRGEEDAYTHHGLKKVIAKLQENLESLKDQDAPS